MKVLAILRAEVFSPNSVEKDKAVMMAVVSRLLSVGHDVEVVSEDCLPLGCQSLPYTVILTMGRKPETLHWLKGLGVRTINPPDGVARCRRGIVERLMQETGIPMPPAHGDGGYWLKRSDTAAQTREDVQYAADETELAERIDGFRCRGIADYSVSAHVEGDVVKFYGVLPAAVCLPKAVGSVLWQGGGERFFRFFYPTDDGGTKFGNELHNGPARHYRFNADELQQAAERLAVAVGVQVYGGDCIVRQDGTFCIIDFNDWPSFSRCREEAADAITLLI